MADAPGLGVFLDADSLDKGDIDFAPLTTALPQRKMQWKIHRETRPDQTATRIGDAEIIVSNKVVLDAQLIQQARKLKLICIAATGTNNVDLRAAKQANIVVCNVTDYCTRSVVEHVFSLIFALRRNLFAYQQQVNNGGWSRSRQFCLLDFPISELAGSVIGIIGHGVLGRAVAATARSFGMKVLICQSLRKNHHESQRTPLDELLAQSDVVSLHCPLSDESAGLIGQRELALMKENALLINTARGGIVDENALLNALSNGRIGGAGIDVLEQEPPQRDNPLIAADLPNLLVTPHIAWASQPARQTLIRKVADNIRAFSDGSAINIVN